MLITRTESKPTLTTFKPDLGGRCHILMGQGYGGNALLRLLEKMPDKVTLLVIFTFEPSCNVDWNKQFNAYSLYRLRLFENQTLAINALDHTLASCIMGTRLYIAGSESFIGLSELVATRYNLNSDEIQREHCGTSSRRVYCVHCKKLNRDITTNIVKCRSCCRHLVVRSHYSRRFAAYMGVMVDAEVPGDIPPINEMFQ